MPIAPIVGAISAATTVASTVHDMVKGSKGKRGELGDSMDLTHDDIITPVPQIAGRRLQQRADNGRGPCGVNNHDWNNCFNSLKDAPLKKETPNANTLVISGIPQYCLAVAPYMTCEGNGATPVYLGVNNAMQWNGISEKDKELVNKAFSLLGKS